MSIEKKIINVAAGVVFAIGAAQMGIGLVTKFNFAANTQEDAIACEELLKKNQTCSLEQQQSLLAVKDNDIRAWSGLCFMLSGIASFRRSLP